MFLMPGGTFSLVIEMERRALFTSNLGVDLIRLPDELDAWDKEEEGKQKISHFWELLPV